MPTCQAWHSWKHVAAEYPNQYVSLAGLLQVIPLCRYAAAPASGGVAAGDTKRLQELEVRLHGSCSVPSGFAFISLPGEQRGLTTLPSLQWQWLHASQHACMCTQGLHAALCSTPSLCRLHANNIAAMNTASLPYFHK